ncbi:putative helix-turn-helix-domain-containing protein type protein [Cladorrhinum sp. PSN332]|nr:putative helix-turn-helix-domain-containing protein type protein [Cladorrhinum sp. PSN332]
MSRSSLYDFAIPIFYNGLNALSHILDVAEAFAEANDIDPDAVYAQARLVEDQLPLVFQIQNATKTISVNVDRLMGSESEPFKDTEKTFRELQSRIKAAAALLGKVDPEAVKQRENVVVDV